MGLQLPATSGDLILNNVTVPSGYANYFLLGYQQLASSGESLEQFLVRQMIYQSVERCAKLVIEQNYNDAITSGNLIQQQHNQFVTNIASEQIQLLGDYDG